MRATRSFLLVASLLVVSLSARLVAQAPCSTLWGPSPPGSLNGYVLAATARGGDLIVGGNFQHAGGIVGNGIARWNGTAWSAMGAGFSAPNASPYPFGRVDALTTLANGDVIAGGSFSGSGPIPAINVARWNGSTWSALGTGLGGVGIDGVSALCQAPNGELFAGGSFTSPTKRIARWTGTTWAALGSGIGSGSGNDIVLAIAALPNGDVLAGGSFSVAGGNPANNIARWNGSTWAPLGSGLSDTVHAIAVLPDGTVVAGGHFDFAGGAPARRVARWDGTTWTPLGTGMGHTSPTYAYYDVNTLRSLPNGDLLAGGSFNLANGTPADYLARWNGSGWSAVNGGAYGFVYACAALANGDIAVAGLAGGFVQVITTTCHATTATFGAGCAGAGGLDTLTANGLPWAGSTFHATVTGLPVPAVAFATYGFTQTAVPLANLLPQGLPGCTALVSPLLTELLVPSANTAVTSVAIPNAPVAIGVNLLEQVFTLETDLSGTMLAVTSSNGLQLTIGAF